MSIFIHFVTTGVLFDGAFSLCVSLKIYKACVRKITIITKTVIYKPIHKCILKMDQNKRLIKKEKNQTIYFTKF